MANQKQAENRGGARLRAIQTEAELIYPLEHVAGLSSSEVLALFSAVGQ